METVINEENPLSFLIVFKYLIYLSYWKKTIENIYLQVNKILT